MRHLMILVFVCCSSSNLFFFFFQAEDGIRDVAVTGVQTCALPIFSRILTVSWYMRTSNRASLGVQSLNPLMSSPAQNVFPAPVRTRMRQSGSTFKIGRASCRERV